MKQLITIILCLFAYNVLAVDTLSYKEIDIAFNKATFPNLENKVESAIPGRCIHKFHPEKITASVLLISFNEWEYEVAPVKVSGQSADYFDNMSWKEIFDIHPEVNTQFYEVIGNISGSGLGLYKKELLGESTAEIREDAKFIILKAFNNNKFVRYCYYQKIY
jgi:hypothetical protein